MLIPYVYMHIHSAVSIVLVHGLIHLFLIFMDVYEYYMVMDRELNIHQIKK